MRSKKRFGRIVYTCISLYFPFFLFINERFVCFTGRITCKFDDRFQKFIKESSCDLLTSLLHPEFFETGSNDNIATAGFLVGELTTLTLLEKHGKSIWVICSIIRKEGRVDVIRYKLSLRRDKGLESLGHWFPRENSIVKQSVVRGVGRAKGASPWFILWWRRKKVSRLNEERFDSSLLWFRRCRRFEGDSSHGIRREPLTDRKDWTGGKEESETLPKKISTRVRSILRFISFN